MVFDLQMKMHSQETCSTEAMTFLTCQTMQMLSNGFFFRNAFKVALSSSIRHVFILSYNFTRIFGNLLVLQKNAFLYFILDLCIQQNRKLEKINSMVFDLQIKFRFQEI